MLDLLCKSAVRRKIIGLFASNPTEELYARQVAREIDESPHAVGLELKALVKGGVLMRTDRHGRILYQWHDKYLYAEILQHTVKTMCEHGDVELRSLADIGWRRELQRELDKAVEKLVHEYGATKVLVFGSMASGRVHKWSDVDLFVVKNTTRRSIDRLKDVIPYLSKSVGMDCVVWTPSEVEEARQSNRFLREEILKKGKVVYDEAA
jgi:uncharacterized protein